MDQEYLQVVKYLGSFFSQYYICTSIFFETDILMLHKQARINTTNFILLLRCCNSLRYQFESKCLNLFGIYLYMCIYVHCKCTQTVKSTNAQF